MRRRLSMASLCVALAARAHIAACGEHESLPTATPVATSTPTLSDPISFVV